MCCVNAVNKLQKLVFNACPLRVVVSVPCEPCDIEWAVVQNVEILQNLKYRVLCHRANKMNKKLSKSSQSPFTIPSVD